MINAVPRSEERHVEGRTVFSMEVRTQGRQTDPPKKFHVCKPPPGTCSTAGSGEAGKRVKEDIIDDAEKTIE